MKPRRIVVFGGTGFVGRRLIPRLLEDGHDLVVPSRNRTRQRELYVLPGVELINADIYAQAELERLLDGADVAINLVGILNEKGRDGAGFHKAHISLTEKIIAACRSSGTHRLLQMSALNAGRGSSHYLYSRGVAEARVKASGLDWTLFQPSVIFGPDDGLFERFASLLRFTPVLPLARAHTKFSPVYVGDVADAFAAALTQAKTRQQTYELYGPEVMTLTEIVQYTAHCLGLHRWVLPLPDTLARIQAAVMDFVPGKPFSTDNFRSLLLDSVGGIDGLYQLGVDKTPIEAVIPAQLVQSQRQQRLDRFRRTARR